MTKALLSEETTPPRYDILAIALRVLEDEPGSAVVLGDAVLATEWFDPRVMQLMWPLDKYPRHGYATKKKRDRAKSSREEHRAGYPIVFADLASRPSLNWARAIAAVLLFGEWSTTRRGWRVVHRQIQRRARQKNRTATIGFELV